MAIFNSYVKLPEGTCSQYIFSGKPENYCPCSSVHKYSSGKPDSVVGLFIWGSLSGGDSFNFLTIKTGLLDDPLIIEQFAMENHHVQ